MLVFHLLGAVNHDTNNSIKSEHVRSKVFRIYSNLNSVFSIIMEIDTNSGMDPTPNPPLPPELNDESETEILD